MKLNHYIRPIPFKATLLSSVIALTVTMHANAENLIGTDLNSSAGADSEINAIYSGNRGSNGGGDQSLQFGDVLTGSSEDDLIVGGLGIDVLFGQSGDDVIVGGTEDFNPFNRDRAFGEEGEDTFIWAPGDGNDFFDGGDGSDVVILSLVGENQGPPNSTAVAPFFGVNGSGDFDGIFVNAQGDPEVGLLTSPGFCEIVERDEANAEALNDLNLHHLVRFVLRGQRQIFNDAIAADPSIDPDTLDTGLRVAVHLYNVEYLVCAGQTAGTIEILDLTQVPAALVDISQLPSRAQRIVAAAQ